MSSDEKAYAQNLGQQLVSFAQEATRLASEQANDIIQGNDRDQNRIQHLLDMMLDFAYYSEMLLLFKRLCRYYFEINPVVTAEYVNFYREMWDAPEEAAVEQTVTLRQEQAGAAHEF
jgi:hypothetical protein